MICAQRVRDAISEAVKEAGSASRLATILHPRVGREYNHRTVSAWRRGDAMPPADVYDAVLDYLNRSTRGRRGAKTLAARVSSLEAWRQRHDPSDRDREAHTPDHTSLEDYLPAEGDVT